MGQQYQVATPDTRDSDLMTGFAAGLGVGFTVGLVVGFTVGLVVGSGEGGAVTVDI